MNHSAGSNGPSGENSPRRWSKKYPQLGTAPLPTDVFTSTELFELERERIFKKAWLNVGRVDRIPNAGDYFVRDIAICQTSIIIVRGEDGEVRAFHNMCSHRGNKIAWDESGNTRAFTCKFHAWAFGLNGELRHVPDEEDFFDLKKCDAGLTPVACDVWEGFIFINVDPGPEETLLEYLGDLATDFAGYPFSRLTTSSNVWTTEIKANWKLAMDAFSENYHIKFLHKRSGADGMVSEANPFAHFLDVKLYPRHGRASVAGYVPKKGSVLRSPMQALAAKYGATSFSSVNGSPAGVNEHGFEQWATELNNIFPNFEIIASENSIFTHSFWPIDVDRTYWELTQYFPKAENAGQLFSQNCSDVFIRDVATEDGSTLEQSQSVLASGARKTLFLKDEEILLRHRHNVVDEISKGQSPQDPAVRQEDAHV